MAAPEDIKSNLGYVPGQSRSRPLEVLSLGLPRTGTKSMAEALEILGYKHCAHGLDMLDNPAYAARWEQAVNAKYLNKGKPFERKDWDELLGHCSAVADMPCATFGLDLFEAYPDAKVVLVQRDEDKWYKSFCAGVIETTFAPSGTFTRNYIEPLLGSRLGAMTLTLLQGFFEAKDAEGMERNARRIYQQHYDRVRATVPAEKLLDYKLGSGWEPLCTFLGKDVPDVEFPWVNEVDALKVKIEEFKVKKRAELGDVVLKRWLPIAVLGISVFVYWRRMA